MEQYNDNLISGKAREKYRESQRILERVERESEQAGTFSISRLTDMVIRKLAEEGRENNAEDTIEVIGRRIGRALAAVMFVVLAASLYLNYIAS